MDGPSKRFLLLSFCGFQIVIFLFVYYLITHQNIFYTEMLSLQNLQIKELNENLTRITLLQMEQGRLISELQLQQKILAGATISAVLVLGAFLLFFYSPGVSPEVVNSQVSAISELFIKQSGTVAEVSWKVGKLEDAFNASQSLLQEISAATQFLLNAAEGVETASKILS